MHQLIEQGSVAQLIVLSSAQEVGAAKGTPGDIPTPIQQIIDQHEPALLNQHAYLQVDHLIIKYH